MTLRHVLQLMTTLIVACACADTPSAGNAANDQTQTLRMAQSIAGDEGPAAFGRIGDVVVDSRGRVLVSDLLAHTVQVFDADGTHQFSIGRDGSGPGELSTPCRMALRGDTLWVRDGGNARHSTYVLEQDSARVLHTVRFAHSDANRWAPVTFDADGKLIDIGFRSMPDGAHAVHHLHVDTDGAVVRTHALPAPPPDSIGTVSVQRQTSTGTATLYAYPPYGPDPLLAHGPRGEYVHGVSSRYRLEWRDADGVLLRTIEGEPNTGPELTAAERARGDSSIVQQVQRMGVARGALGFDVPSHKPPLRDAWFDADGRLWVELSVAGGADRRAHVYAPDGARVMTVIWPANVSLSYGHASGDDVWGIAHDELDVESVVRLAAGFP